MKAIRPARFALILAIITAAVGCAAAKPYRHGPLGIQTWDPNSTSIEAKEALVQRFDALADQLPEQKLITSQYDMYEWAVEALPYMPYEGIRPNGSAVVPQDILLFFRLDSRAFHLGGQAQCRDFYDNPVKGPVMLNGRYTNPVSPRYGVDGALPVLIHELVHMQGGPFCSGESEDLEANTQIAAMEVLAAMVNHGNTAALRPLLLELRGMGLSSLQYELSRADYMAFLATVADDPFEIARQEKSYRYWTGHEGGEAELSEILWKYNVVPFNSIIEAAYDGTVERIQVETEFLCPPCTLPIPTRAMPADDLAYWFRHVDAYVAAAR